MTRLIVLALTLALIGVYALMGATAASGATPQKQIKALKHQVVVLKKQRRALRVKVRTVTAQRNGAQTVSDARGRWLTETTLRWIAANTTHGWTQNGLPYEEMAARLRAGERLVIACGYVSQLAVHILNGYGLEARPVGVLSLDPPNGFDDGHALIEVRPPGGTWTVYDLDMNRQPVDGAGAGMTVQQFVDVSPRQYVLLANDQAVDWTGHEDYRPMFEYVFASPAGLERWYDHILGVVQ